MTIRELQKKIADALNGVEALVQGGCKAFPEDTREIYGESNQWISGGKVALVVVTPDFERTGSGTEDALPAEGDLLIRCVERVPLSRENPAVIRALDAAQIVAHTLDGETLEWKSIRQTIDQRNSTITATVTFGFDIAVKQSQNIPYDNI